MVLASRRASVTIRTRLPKAAAKVGVARRCPIPKTRFLGIRKLPKSTAEVLPITLRTVARPRAPKALSKVCRRRGYRCGVGHHGMRVRLHREPVRAQIHLRARHSVFARGRVQALSTARR